jgi:phage/plasmid-like protein (TIGR03299 family)
MSQESSEWLNQHTLIGFTDKRGSAWHYRESDQGAESNHYPGAIPAGDVERRLFWWEPVYGEISNTWTDEDGTEHVNVPDKLGKSIINPSTGLPMGYFKDGYQIHGRKQWLMDNLTVLLDDELAVGSAGELKGGAVAWVQVELPENFSVNGVEFRPFFGAATSFDGSLSSTYFAGNQLVVCDNTLSAGLSGASDVLKYKHSRNSLGKLIEARQALRLVYQGAEDFEKEVQRLTETTVTDDQWRKFLDLHAPLTRNGVPLEPGRSLTMATSHQDSLSRLWNHDQRVTPWKNTAFGVIQAVNTYEQHVKSFKGAHRAERNASRVISGDLAKSDREAYSQLQLVLAV